MPAQRPWIRQVVISDSVRQKLLSKHGVHPDQVNEACLFGRQESAREEVDPNRGPRLIVQGTDRDGRRLRVLLKPIDIADGIYRCITARMVT